MWWAKLIIAIASWSIVLPIAITAVRYHRLNKAMIAVVRFVFLGAIIELVSSYLSSRHQNNLWLLHLYTPLEFACILWFFYHALNGALSKSIFWGAAAGFGLLSGLNSAFFQPIDTFNTYARSLEGILIIALCLFWCYRTLVEMKIQRLEKDPAFWAMTGFLLYFSGNVLLFAFSNYILYINKSMNLYIWAFHALFSILLHLFITTGLWKAR